MALCLRDGWEFCRPEHAADSTFRFLFEQWKDHLPSGQLLKEAYIDQPFEEDACRCHFVFIQDSTLSIDPQLVLKYHWFLGENFQTLLLFLMPQARFTGQSMKPSIKF